MKMTLPDKSGMSFSGLNMIPAMLKVFGVGMEDLR